MDFLSWGDLPEPVIRRDEPEENRIIPTHAEAEYVHDFLVFATLVFQMADYEREIGVRVRFDHVEGYRLAVDAPTHRTIGLHSTTSCSLASAI